MAHQSPRVDCLEGQRPRLTHFSTTGEAESLSDSTATLTPLVPPAAHANKNNLPTLRRRFAAEAWDAKGLACPTLDYKTSSGISSAFHSFGAGCSRGGSRSGSGRLFYQCSSFGAELRLIDRCRKDLSFFGAVYFSKDGDPNGLIGSGGVFSEWACIVEGIGLGDLAEAP